ncbi:MAG: putative ABC transporter permease, putative spermidine/putrescine transport system permease protein [Chloroflexi bacterium CSP1-4]|nr:MAG: putative ABC transporter permease, putative spermidine/putrescine transport system permease protein [Chloroflexi bacterium CSP1-4]
MTDSWRQPRRLLLLALGALTVFFLMAPTLVVVPMSVTASNALTFPPEGFSTRWYEKMLTDPQWSSGFVNSAQVAFLTAVLATVLGTLAALGTVRGRFPGKSAVNALVLSPLIVPVIIIAIGMFSLFVRWKISGSIAGLVLAHTALAVPFVVINVATSLRTIDRNLELAAMNLGADPVRTFRRVTLPLILPGVLAGGLFAFITSWDEVVVSIFLTTARFRTLPVEMWEQVRQVVDPTVAAVATTLLAVTTSLLLLVLVVRRQAPAR